jgi:hypothetical protein
MRCLPWVLIVAIWGCAAVPDGQSPAPGAARAGKPAGPAAPAAASRESLEDILNTPLSAADYPSAERCLSSYDFRGVEVLDDRHVVFEGRGGRLWLNRLSSRCIGLRPGDTLRFTRHSGRLCTLDHFDAVDEFASRWSRTSGTCSLGAFHPVTREQVEALDAAL